MMIIRNKNDENSMLKVDEQSMKIHQNSLNIHEHSIKIRSKIEPKSINIDQKSILEASGPPSAFLDAFWAALGPVWRRLGG